MKRINEYKKLFEVDGAIELAPLKKKYRLLVKEWNPYKLPNGGEKAIEAEEISRKVIDGYHVSIDPETEKANMAEYTVTTKSAMVDELKHKLLLLEITIADGNT